jgi:hypothetical protein
MHSKFIVSDGVVAAVLAINALANTHLGDAIFGLHNGRAILHTKYYSYQRNSYKRITKNEFKI